MCHYLDATDRDIDSFGSRITSRTIQPKPAKRIRRATGHARYGRPVSIHFVSIEVPMPMEMVTAHVELALALAVHLRLADMLCVLIVPLELVKDFVELA